MNNLISLDAAELLTRTKTLVAEERRVTLAVIEHLAEINRRMLYAKTWLRFALGVRHPGAGYE